MTGFEEVERELENLAEEFSERVSGRISGSGMDPVTGEFQSPDGYLPKRLIREGMGKALNSQDGVVEDMRRNAKNHVPPRDARTIRATSENWDLYRVSATSDLVGYHEFGTGSKAEDPEEGTTNAPPGEGPGYVIPLNGYASLPGVTPENVSSKIDEIEFQYSVHPGVRGKRFIRSTIKNNYDKFEDEVAESLDNMRFDLD